MLNIIKTPKNFGFKRKRRLENMSLRLSQREYGELLEEIRGVDRSRKRKVDFGSNYSIKRQKKNEINQWLQNNEMKNKLKRKFDGYRDYINTGREIKRRKVRDDELYHQLPYKHAQKQLRTQEGLKCDNGGIFHTPLNVDKKEGAANLDFEKGIVNPNLMSGYEILDLLRALLDMFEWEREENQVEFHEHFIATVLPKIFKNEWETEYDKILRLFKKTKHDAETIMICPRRWGKTVSVAMFCAAYILALPDAEIAIFSTAKRTSGKMMMGVLKFMQELPLFEHCEILVKNAETIKISLYGNVRTISCYPGTVAVCIFFLKVFHFWLFLFYKYGLWV